MEVHLTGEILGMSDAQRCSGSHCRWSFVTGDNWRVLQGTTEGHTQTDVGSDAEGMSVFSSPFDVHYACSSLSGWPKLSLRSPICRKIMYASIQVSKQPCTCTI